MMRLDAAQRWPALEKDASRAQCTALSRSASSQTTSAFLPPSSSDNFLSCPPAFSAISRPTRVEPVKEITSTSSCSTSGGPTSGPSPWITLIRPGGRPASSATCAMKAEDAGVCSAGFSTTALPQISAGKTFQAKFGAGVFAAMISASDAAWIAPGHRPAMWRAARHRAPEKPLPLAGEEAGALDGGGGFAQRIALPLARLQRDDLGKLLPPRLDGVCRPHAGYRRGARPASPPTRAARHARPAPQHRRPPRLSVPAGRSDCRYAVKGSRSSRPPTAGCSAPAMRLPTKLGYASGT